MLRTGQLLAPLKRDFVAPLRRTESLPPPGAVLPRTLVSPRTGLSPAGCRELVARFTLRHHLLPPASRAAGRTRNSNFRRRLDSLITELGPDLSVPTGIVAKHGRR